MKVLLAVVAGLVIFAIIGAFVVFMVLYFRDPAKGKDFLAALAMFTRSVFKSKHETKRAHKRAIDTVEHTHERKPPRKTFAMTMRDFIRKEDIDVPK